MNTARCLFLVLGLFCTAAAPLSVHAATDMDRVFQKLERSFKKLNMGLKDPSEAARDIYVGLANTMREQAAKARDMVPAKTSTLAEGERETFLAKYRGEMDGFITTIDRLTEALKASRWEEARAQMEAMRKEKKEGHRVFMDEK